MTQFSTAYKTPVLRTMVSLALVASSLLGAGTTTAAPGRARHSVPVQTIAAAKAPDAWSYRLTPKARQALRESLLTYAQALRQTPAEHRDLPALLQQQSHLHDALEQALTATQRRSFLASHPLLSRDAVELRPSEQPVVSGQSCLAAEDALDGASVALQAGLSRLLAATDAEEADASALEQAWLWASIAAYDVETARYLSGLAVDDLSLAFSATELAERALEDVSKVLEALSPALSDGAGPVAASLSNALVDLQGAVRYEDRCDQTPLLERFTPASGLPGTVVTLTGENLDHLATVRLDQQETHFIPVSSTQLRMVVPGNASSGLVCVSNLFDTQCSQTPFVVFRPSATSGTAAGQGRPGHHTPAEGSGQGSDEGLVVNAAPVANAGSAQNVPYTTTVTLDGSKSSDADGNPLQYAWTVVSKPTGSTAVLSSATVVKPTFVADKLGTYTFQLIVNDGTSNSAASQVKVTAYDPLQLSLTLTPTSVSTYGTTSGQVTLTETKAADLVINIASSNPTVAAVGASTVTVKAGQLTSNAVTITAGTVAGSSTITAFATAPYKDGTATLSVSNRTFTQTFASSLVGVGLQVTGTLTLAQPAPQALTVQVSAPAATIVSLCAPDGTGCAASYNVAFAAGQTVGSYSIKGVSAGTTNITAAAAGFTSVSTSITATNNIINVQSGAKVGKGQTLPLSVGLANAAAANVSISFTTTPAGIASITPVTILAGQTVPATNPTITGVEWGTVTIQAVATAYASQAVPATVGQTLTITPASISVLTSNTANASVNLSAPAPAGGLVVNLTVANSALATVASPITVPAGSSSASVVVSGVSAGSTTLTASGAAGISTITAGSASVVVSNAPAINLTVPAYVGYNQQTALSSSLGLAAPAGNAQVTFTSSDPTRMVVSSSATTVGSGSVTVTAAAGSTAIPAVYLQGLASSGSATLTVTASGYTTKTGSVALYPSGFAFNNNYPIDFTTTTDSPDKPLYFMPVVLDPTTLAIKANGTTRGGLSQAVTVSSSNTAVGTVAGLSFGANIGSLTGAFHSVGTAGTTTLTVVQPTGYAVPTTRVSGVATVTAPPITLSNVTIGKNLQTTITGTLGAPAPAGNLVVTLTTDGAKALLATSATAAGAASINVTVGAGATALPTVYVQALTSTGTAAVTATATGYATGSNTVTLVPSGFVLYNPSNGNMSTRTLNTTVTAANSTVGVYAVPLAPVTLTDTYAGVPTTNAQGIRPGIAPLAVTVTSSATTIGTIVTSPVSFTAGANHVDTAFNPVATGTTTLTAVAPANFSTPANYTVLTATVTGAPITLASYNNLSIGKDLQNVVNVTLGTAAPAGNTTVTVTSSDPTKLKLSTSPTVVGTASVSVIVFAGSTTSSTKVYAQALAGEPATTATVTATATGYSDGSVTLNLVPAGFVLYNPSNGSMTNRTLTTTALSASSTLGVYAVPLDGATYNDAYTGVPSYNAQSVRAGMAAVSVPVTSSNTAVGAITASPLSFAPGTSYVNTTFDPLTAGTATLTVGVPTGFATAANYRTLDATVSAPGITLASYNSQSIGKNLQHPLTVTLATAAPTGGVTVTLTSPDTSKLLLSNSTTTLGAASASVTFAAGATTSTTKVYAQALVGTATAATQVTVTASAPSYSTGSVTLNLVPSGFVLYNPANGSMSNRTLTTTTLSASPTVGVYAVPLDPVTLNDAYSGVPTYNAQALRPGAASVSVPLTSSNAAVGTLTSSPLTFAAGTSFVNTSFDPASAGTTDLTLSTPTGYTTPSNYQTLTATVTAPAINVSSTSNLAIGENLEHPLNITLGVAAPTGGVSVTLTSPDTTKLLFSSSNTTVGAKTASISFNAGSTTSTGKIYAQALAGDPTTTVTVTASAPGYANQTLTLTLVPSGFVLYNPSNGNMTGRTLTTTTLSNPATVGVYAVPLDPNTLNDTYTGVPTYNMQAVRPGLASVSVPLTSSDTAVGTLTSAPLAFAGGTASVNTTFDPAAAGTTTLTVGVPTGFATPSNYRTLAATVTAPAITVSSLNSYAIGKDLQNQLNVTLAVAAPTGGVTVTLTSPDTTRLLLSTSTTTLGTGSVTVNISAGATSNSTTKVYAQSLDSSGTIGVVASAPQYATSTGTLSLAPSGFALYDYSTESFTTTTSALATSLKVYPVVLNPSTLIVVAIETLRPGMSNTKVPVTSSQTAVGTITLSPVTFQGGDNPNYQTTSFQPKAVGTTVISVGAPTGFSLASDRNNVTVTVN